MRNNSVKRPSENTERKKSGCYYLKGGGELRICTTVHGKEGIFAEILEQSLGARNRFVPASQATKAGGNDSLESIPGLLKSLKIWALLRGKGMIDY